MKHLTKLTFILLICITGCYNNDLTNEIKLNDESFTLSKLQQITIEGKQLAQKKEVETTKEEIITSAREGRYSAHITIKFEETQDYLKTRGFRCEGIRLPDELAPYYINSIYLIDWSQN